MQIDFLSKYREESGVGVRDEVPFAIALGGKDLCGPGSLPNIVLSHLSVAIIPTDMPYHFARH